jgi:hypothetical protein
MVLIPSTTKKERERKERRGREGVRKNRSYHKYRCSWTYNGAMSQ